MLLSETTSHYLRVHSFHRAYSSAFSYHNDNAQQPQDFQSLPAEVSGVLFKFVTVQYDREIGATELLFANGLWFTRYNGVSAAGTNLTTRWKKLSEVFSRHWWDEQRTIGDVINDWREEADKIIVQHDGDVVQHDNSERKLRKLVEQLHYAYGSVAMDRAIVSVRAGA